MKESYILKRLVALNSELIKSTIPQRRIKSVISLNITVEDSQQLAVRNFNFIFLFYSNIRRLLR